MDERILPGVEAALMDCRNCEHRGLCRLLIVRGEDKLTCEEIARMAEMEEKK